VPLRIATLLAENAEELAARLRERFRSYERIKNGDLDRAVTRSGTRDMGISSDTKR